jgi:hypothetical protein
MKRLGVAFAMAAVLTILPANQPAFANNGVAFGILGGLAAGTIIGAAVAQPRYYYEPVPVVVAPPPAPVGPGCYWARGERVWDEYRGVWFRPRIQVCD